jgi:hypothetical protein
MSAAEQNVGVRHARDLLEWEIRDELAKLERLIEIRTAPYNQKQRDAIARCRALIQAAWPRDLGPQLDAVQMLDWRLRLAERRRTYGPIE